MSFEVTVTPTVYDVDVSVNPSVQPFDVEVTVGSIPTLNLTTNGDSGASTFDPLTGELNIPNYTLDGLGGVPESRTLTINGTTQDLSANRTFTIPAPDPVTIGSPANGLAIDGNQVLTIGLASGSQTGALSSTDWSTFNNKQNALGYTAEDVANKSTDTGLGTSNTLYPSQGAVKSYIDTGLSGKENALGFTPENVANKAINFTSPDDTKYPTTLAVSTALAGKQDLLTNPITGTGVSGQVSFWTGTSTQSGDNGLFWDNSTKNLRINQLTDAGYRLDVNGTARIQATADTTPLTISGYSLTGSNDQSALSITGTWNTTGTPTALLVNITDTASNASSLLCAFRVGGSNRFFVRKDGTIQFLAASISNGGGFAGASYSTGTSTLSSAFNTFNSRFNYTNTSGDTFQFRGLSTFSPTSGSGTITGFVVQNTINQTGGANGITRGLYLNPTLTSAADWRSIEWSNNTGRGLWGVGTADNAMAGALNIGSATNANASAILELTSTTRGLLPPRMTGAQAEAISSPAEGLLVYSTDGTGTTITSKGWWGFDGSTWAQLN